MTALINNYLKLLGSKKLLSNVKKDLHLTYSTNELSDKIKYSSSDSSQLIEITRKDLDDTLAVKICNQVVEELKKQVYEIYGIKNITIVDEAKANGKTVYSKSFVIVLVTLLGCLSSSVLIIVKFIFSNKLMTFNNEKQVLGIPILGKITHYQEKNSSLIDINLLEKDENRVRNIRTNLLSELTNAKTIMVTSINHNRSKSYMTYHLAKSLEKINKKVLLIDVNRKDGNLSQTFLKQTTGILDVLTEQQSLSKIKTNISGIDMISIGDESKIDLLSSKEFANILNSLKEEYDYIFIETPPYKNNFESLSILNLVDTILIISEVNKNKIKDIEEIKKKAHHQNLGILFVKHKTNHFSKKTSTAKEKASSKSKKESKGSIYKRIQLKQSKKISSKTTKKEKIEANTSSKTQPSSTKKVIVKSEISLPKTATKEKVSKTKKEKMTTEPKKTKSQPVKKQVTKKKQESIPTKETTTNKKNKK